MGARTSQAPGCHARPLGAADRHRLLPDGFGGSYPLDAVQGVGKLNQLAKGLTAPLIACRYGTVDPNPIGSPALGAFPVGVSPGCTNGTLTAVVV